MNSPLDIFEFLKQHGITWEKFDHPAVFTVEESGKLDLKMPGAATKNLFLRDKNGLRHFLVTVGHEKNVDLKELKKLLGVSKLGFASPERLKEYLGVTPGSVTLLGLIHDSKHAVEIIIDEKLRGQALQCHPLVNTATVVISHEGMKKFFEATGHTPKILDIPTRT